MKSWSLDVDYKWSRGESELQSRASRKRIQLQVPTEAIAPPAAGSPRSIKLAILIIVIVPPPRAISWPRAGALLPLQCLPPASPSPSA